MLGSMYSAVSGLSAHQTKMNVIGNNIANVNTYGFKASRVTFSDVFYQTMSGASAPSTSGGGTNPTQLGYGAKVNSVDVLNTRAGSATTDRALDVYINGDGYLPVKNSEGTVRYTRVGVLSFDLAGNLVDSNGNQVLGFRLDDTTKAPQLESNGTTTAQNLVAININPSDIDKYTGIAIGQSGEITAIREGDPAFVPSANTGWMQGTPTVAGTSLYSGSVNMTARKQFTPNAAIYNGTAPLIVSSNAHIDDTAAMTLERDGLNFILHYTPEGGAATTVSGTLNSTTTPPSVTFTGIVDDDGGSSAFVTIPIDAANGFTIADPTAGPGVDLGTLDADTYLITATTTDKSGATVTLNETWADAADTSFVFGDITITIDPAKFQAALDEGLTDVIIGNVGPGPGEPIKIAQIAVARFINADGLSQDGEGYFLETTNSGNAIATIPGNGGTGNLRAGALEMSNVDLSREFTEMIIAQRGFQANTRMITVSDEMLAELVSMKR